MPLLPAVHSVSSYKEYTRVDEIQILPQGPFWSDLAVPSYRFYMADSLLQEYAVHWFA